MCAPDGEEYAAGNIPQYVLCPLPELLAAPPGETVWFVEGEKDVETLIAAGLTATTNAGGCHHGWKYQYAEDLRDRHVVVVSDADGPGQALAQAIAEELGGIAASVVVARLPLCGRDDGSDWLARRGQILSPIGTLEKATLQVQNKTPHVRSCASARGASLAE